MLFATFVVIIIVLYNKLLYIVITKRMQSTFFSRRTFAKDFPHFYEKNIYKASGLVRNVRAKIGWCKNSVYMTAANARVGKQKTKKCTWSKIYVKSTLWIHVCEWTEICAQKLWNLLLIHTLMNSSNVVLRAAARGLHNEFSDINGAFTF